MSAELTQSETAKIIADQVASWTAERDRLNDLIAHAIGATPATAELVEGELDAPYPYDALFRAIGDSTKITAGALAVSVKQFVETLAGKGYQVVSASRDQQRAGAQGVKTWQQRMPTPRRAYQCSMNCSGVGMEAVRDTDCGDCLPVEIPGDPVAARDAEIADLRAQLAQVEANSEDISAHLGRMTKIATEQRERLSRPSPGLTYKRPDGKYLGAGDWSVDKSGAVVYTGIWKDGRVIALVVAEYDRPIELVQAELEEHCRLLTNTSPDPVRFGESVDTPEFRKRFEYMLSDEYAQLVADIDAWAAHRTAGGTMLPVGTLAWALIATNGNIIIWSRNRSTVQGYQSRYPTATLTPVIGAAGGTQDEWLRAARDELANKISTMKPSTPIAYAPVQGAAYRHGYRDAVRGALRIAIAPSANALDIGKERKAMLATIAAHISGQDEEDARKRHERRFEFLHSTNKDADGWEWGVARVRVSPDSKIECLWGASDHSDLDAAIAATSALIAPPVQL